jgi:hypothetical protein
MNAGKAKEGTVLASGKDTYYDIQITDSFAVFLDYQSDSVIQIYKKDDFSKLYQVGIKKEGPNGWGANLKFTKSDTLNRHSNSLLLMDNRFSNEVRLSVNKSGEISPSQTCLLPPYLVNSTNYNLTSTDILGVPIDNNANTLFYFYSSNQYYRVKPETVLPSYFSSISNVYLTNLCANEKEQRIVSALRFVNYIQFYDFDASLKTSVIIGDSIAFPKLDSRYNEIDILNTRKYIIDIYGTSGYVYCLYNGYSDYSAQSTLFVFNWKGKLHSTIKFDRFIKKMAVDNSDTYAITLAQNEKDGYDIVKYTLE